MRREVYDEVEAYEMADLDIEVYETELVSVDDELAEADVAESEHVVAASLREEADVISEDALYFGVSELDFVSESIEAVAEVPEDLQEVDEPDMTKERYEALTDKEKVEWLGIEECNVQDAIQRFISKLDSIGVVYRYSDDMLDEFMRLESVVAQMKREQNEKAMKQDKKIESKSRGI